MKVLVTGSSGFIGTNFCERFGNSRSNDVVGVDCREAEEKFSGVEYARVDLRNRVAVRELLNDFEPEVIVHLAAQARVDPSLTDPIGTYDRNVLATVNLLDAALAVSRQLECFVYASSETVYGPSDRYPTLETVALRPQSAYAASKAASEFLVRNANGLPHVILRSAMGYGPRSNPQEQVVAKFLRKALRGESILFPNGVPLQLHPTRDINHVQNYLDALEKVIRAGVEGTFNVGSGEETSILDLAYRIVDIVGSGSVKFDSHFRYRPGEVGLRTWLDISRAREAFGYEPRVSLSEGLRGTRDWLLGHIDCGEWAPVAEAGKGHA